MKQRIAGALLGLVLVAAGPAGPASAATTASTVSDSWITAKTKMSLAADGRVKGRQVSVETVKGKVLLRGKVDTEEAKAAAEEVAKGVEGAGSVKNELQVVAPSSREAVEEKDDAVTERVKKAFAKDKDLSKAGIGVMTNAGVVSLTGEAPDLMTSAKASWEAWKQTGVRSVKNDLTLKP